jgi:catechol 2,3-dioxygenase-like lactoylglutathione lyase family enzyme
MASRVTPMVHVPDVAATVEWYRALGFTVVDINEDDGVPDWAMMAFGEGVVMFNAGGRRSTAERRDVDLYVHTTEDVDQLHDALPPEVEVIEAPHDTFYRAREFILRDVNGFWVTFGRDLLPA